jgi:adenosine deaminase
MQTGAVSSLAEHPVDTLYRAGASISINCDGRTISQTSLQREYAQIQERFGWGTTELLTCNLEAVRAAFIPESLKHKLALRLMAEYPIATT